MQIDFYLNIDNKLVPKINEFIQLNYYEIVKMAEKITQCQDYEEVAHYVIEQFMLHPKAEDLIKRGEAMKFMSGMIYRNYKSSTSPYHKLYRQSGRVFAKDQIESNTPDTEYDRELDLQIDAVQGILEDMKAEGIHYWYISTLFEMWVDTPNYSELSRKTNIPRTSISEAVEEARQYIIKRLQDNGIID